MIKKFIFVYNADSGKWNAYLDMAHKIFSPKTYPCSLCDITYRIFKIRPEWENFIKNTPIPFEFLHKDEFESQYPNSPFSNYPFILAQNEEGNIAEFIAADELNEIKDVSALIKIMKTIME
jgi:hypothetical protein